MNSFINRRLVLATVVALMLIAFTFVWAMADGPKPSVSINQAGDAIIPMGGVLYDQTNNPSGNGAPAQNFEPAFDIYDNEGADDFVVPASTQWTISNVIVVGTQSTGGTPASINVNFYADNATFPAATPTCSYANVATFTGNTTINVTLPSACILGPGNWWMAFQVNQNFGGGGGQFFWSNRTTQNNNGSVWRNPGGGFGTPCTSWGRQTACGVGGSTNPDFLFQIIGASGPLAQPAIDVDLTVSTDGSCGTSNAITADYGSDVTFCYQVENTGNITLTQHTVEDDVFGTILNGATYALAPGATFAFTQTYTLMEENLTNVMTWTAFITGTQISADGSATATVTGQPTDVALSGIAGQASSSLVLIIVAAMALFAGAILVRRQQS